MREETESGGSDITGTIPLRAHLLGVALCLLLSLLFVAPWLPNARTVPTVYSPAVERYARIDIAIWTYLLSRGARHFDRFYDGNILVPMRNALASNDHRLTEGIWTIPLFRLFEPLIAWGLAILIALWTTSWATWLAGWHLTGSRWGGAAAAVLFGFGLFRANHVVHIEGLFNPCLPLALVAMVFWFERPTRRRGLLCTLLITGALIEYSYIAVALGLVLPPTFFFAVWRRRLPFFRGLAPLVVALLLATLLLLPIACVYLSHHRETQLTRSLIENHFFSADCRAWLTAPTGHVLPPFGPVRVTHPSGRRVRLWSLIVARGFLKCRQPVIA